MSTFAGDTVIMLVSQVVFFIGGWIFFMKQLFRDYEVSQRTVQLVFSITFALSCTMFELIIFEILGFLDPGSRRFHWKVGLYAMLVNLICAIPVYVAHSLMGMLRFVGRGAALPLTVLAWLAFIYFFWKLGDPFPILSPKHGIFSIEQHYLIWHKTRKLQKSLQRKEDDGVARKCRCCRDENTVSHGHELRCVQNDYVIVSMS